MKLKRQLPLTMLIFSCLSSAPALAQEQDIPPSAGALSELRDKMAQVGVHLRADAPLALRNAQDRNLPVYLEIINGVEKTGYSALTKVSGIVNRPPLKFEGVKVFVKPTGKRRHFAAQPILLGESPDFTLDARVDGQPQQIADRWRKLLQIPRERLEAYLQQNFLGGPFQNIDLWVSFRLTDWPAQDFFLRVQMNAPPFPKLEHWYRGDMHYHSAYTDNAAERGYPLEVVRQAGMHAGLDWTMVTDHSCDIDPKKYKALRDDIMRLRDERFMIIRGEEVTVQSGREKPITTLHMLAYPSPDDPDRGFPDAADPASDMVPGGDGSASSPGIPLAAALEQISSAGGFAYASHPFDPLHAILRGGDWDMQLDYLNPAAGKPRAGLFGLQSWNRGVMMTADDTRDPFCVRPQADPAGCFQPDAEVDQYLRLQRGIERGWQPLLLKSLEAADRSREKSVPFKVFLGAGSDAHGDLNYEVTLDAGDFLAKPYRAVNGYVEDNGWGKVWTMVYCPDGMGPRGEHILRGLREGRTILSNGPLVVAGFDRNANGSLNDPEDIGIGGHLNGKLKDLPPLSLAWVSSKEFGPLESLRVVVGTLAGEAELESLVIPPERAMASESLVTIDVRPRLQNRPGAWCYLRLEARAKNSAGEEFRCYTNPIWIRIR